MRPDGTQPFCRQGISSTPTPAEALSTGTCGRAPSDGRVPVPNVTSEGHPRGNGDGPLTPERSETTTGAEAIMPNPPCPECGQPATQGHTRELSPTEHEVTGVCPAGHLWVVKWFAERSA